MDSNRWSFCWLLSGAVGLCGLTACASSDAVAYICLDERSSVTFEPAIVEPGSYVIALSADAQQGRCEVTLRADGASDGNPVCEGSLELGMGRRNSSAEDGSGVSAPYGLNGLAWDGLSAEVTVKVERDGAPWRSGHAVLQSEPGCEGSELRSATLELR